MRSPRASTSIASSFVSTMEHDDRAIVIRQARVEGVKPGIVPLMVHQPVTM